MLVRALLVAFVTVFVFSPALSAEDAVEEAAETKSDAAPVASVEKVDKPGSLSAGKALMDEGKWAEAAAYFEGIGQQEAANGMKKREPWRLNNWARCLVEMGEYEKAAETARKGLEIDDSIRPLHNNLGAALSRAGKHDEAIEHFKASIAKMEAKGEDAAKMKANLQFLEDAKAGLIDEQGNRVEKTTEGEAPMEKKEEAGEEVTEESKD